MIDPAKVRRALDLARWAPSAHNTQPWSVVVQGDRILIRADPSRELPHCDPTRRDLFLSLGAFAEALRIGLAAEGVGVRRGDPPADAFAVLVPDGTPAAEPDAPSLLRQRQSSRLAMSRRPPEPAVLEALAKSATGVGLRLHLVSSGGAEWQRWRDLFFVASREAWLDTRATAELQGWIRFDPEGVRRPADGLSTHCLNLGATEGAALMVALRPGLWRAAERVFAAPLLAEQMAKSEVRTFEACPTIGLLSCSAGPRDAGAGLLRFWMEATRQRVFLHPVSVLLDRRGWEAGRLLGVNPRQLVFAFRLGRSVPPPRSNRREVSSFARIAA